MSFTEVITGAELFQNLRKSTVVATGWLCTIGGLVADVLQPIAPFAFYIFVPAAMVLVLLLWLYLKGNKNVVVALAMAGIASGVFGLMSLLQSGEESQQQGILASTVPAVASMQQSLGIIDQKLDDIKRDTESIKSTTDRLDTKSDAILKSLDEIRQGFGSGGIISKPSSPEQHYHNARLHELGGDYLAARRSYLEYFKSDLPILDPHLRFIAFLKVQEGTAGARETYNAITARSGGPMPAYARLLLRNTEQRISGLQAYFEEHPNFAAAAYHLSLEYSELRLGGQTLSDKRQELKFLKAFQTRDEEGGLLRYLVDQDLAREWRDDARARRQALEARSNGVLENPVSMSWMSHNAGWNGNISISEPAQEIRWNIKGQTQPMSTGSSGYNDPTTGKPSPRSFFSLPRNQQDTTIEISYTDLSGVEQGPFEFAFKASKESEDGNRRILEMTSTSWLSFRDYNGQTLVYFTHLMSYRGALSNIEYGINRAQPNKSFRFPAWKKPGLAPINASTPLTLTVPFNTKYITAQLTYKNGDKSAVMRFDRD